MEEHLRGLGLEKAGERTQGFPRSFCCVVDRQRWLSSCFWVVSEGPSFGITHTDPPVSGPGSEAGDWEAPGPHPVFSLATELPLSRGHHASEQKQEDTWLLWVHLPTPQSFISNSFLYGDYRRLKTCATTSERCSRLGSLESCVDFTEKPMLSFVSMEIQPLG